MVKNSDSGKKSKTEDRRIARRERRREQSREEILDATLRVLLRDGVRAFTIEAVAEELQLTKAALYYYFDSKDALVFEVVFRQMEAEARAIHDAVEEAEGGAEALRKIVETMFQRYSGNYDLFRLIYMHGQVSGPVNASPEQLERIRPLNALFYGGTEAKLKADGARGNPRRLAFLAHMSAVGTLTMKGMVEMSDDPLIHRDDDLIEDTCRAFIAAAGLS